METFQICAYNAGGDQLWLRGEDLDAQQHVEHHGIRGLQDRMQALKWAPRYNPDNGRFTRNRVALITLWWGGFEERWIRTGAGDLVRVLADGTVIEHGSSVSPEPIRTSLSTKATLRATRALRRRPAAEAADIIRPAQVTAPVAQEPAMDSVPCPKCEGKMGFSVFAHVPHKHVGGLCFECDGKGVVPVADADAYNRRQQAAQDARRAKNQARAEAAKAQQDAAHDAAFDRYGDDYRLVYALARYDHPATMDAVFLINAYRDNDAQRIRRAQGRIPSMLQSASLDGMGLEEIEALGTLEV
ncbi:hypothetical protein WKI65_43705 [Streptomyces sp. MS1.AVA.3]|uniref:hypothetical protein n=1 Tax=Streptomyces decoyicus TaxID=249567 RepID=UPI0030BA2C37